MAAPGRIAEGFLAASDGIRLFYRRWQTESASRATCLLVHFCEAEELIIVAVYCRDLRTDQC